MYRIFKEENPRAYISNYGLPDEHLHAIRYYQTQADNEAVLAKWRQFSKRRQMSAAISDYANPVFYITTPDLAQWEKDVQTTVAEIRKRYPDKKSSATSGRNIIPQATARISNNLLMPDAGRKCSKSAANIWTA